MSSRSLDQRRLGDYGFFTNFILGRKQKPALTTTGFGLATPD
jgi:hypothetical protein